MDTYTCIAVDDEYLALSVVEDYVSRIPGLNLIGKYKSALEAMELIQKQEVDILFLDIQMPDINGVDFIRTLTHKPKVVFTTAYQEYALEGYELDVIDYLLKPIRFERFVKAVNKAIELIKLNKKETALPVEIKTPNNTLSKDYFFVKSGYKSEKVNFSDILYVEGLKEYINIYTTEKKYTRLDRLKNMEELLPSKDFVRVHKSFIVAVNKVKSFYGNTLEVDGENIPIGRSYKERVNKVFS